LLIYLIAASGDLNCLLSLSLTLATAYGLPPDSVSIIALIVTGCTSGAQRAISASFIDTPTDLLAIKFFSSGGGVTTFVF